MPRLKNISKNCGKLGRKTRNINRQKTRIKFMCRVCLTLSNVMMYDLYDTFDLSEDKSEICEVFTIYEALEKVTSSKIILHQEYPSCICPVCLSILKMSLKFIYQFEESHTKLKNISNGINSEISDIESNSKEKSENSLVDQMESPVELIVGENKFSLKDLLVVEKPELDDCDFRGFLNNLGNEVTASFADRNEIRIESENSNGNHISISLVGKDKVLPVKEVEVDEDTNTIKWVVLENELDTEQFQEEIFRFEIESDNDRENGDSETGINDVDVEAFIIEKGVEKSDKKKIERNDLTVKMGKEDVTKEEIDDEFEKEIKYPCDLCGKIFNFPDRLSAHKRRIHFRRLKTYTCEICGYKNNTLSAHKHHKTKHGGKKWSCEICKKSYYTKAVLKVHLESHNNRRQHLCTVCGKGFNYSNALIYHMRLHTGEKNYICEYCNQRFRMPNSLIRHLRCHTGERPYECRFCEKAFRSKGELNCHESGHTGIRPYHCEYCQKGFSKIHNLKLHLLSHGGPHECELCGKNFVEPSILMMHYKVSHRDMVEEFEHNEQDLNQFSQ